MYIALDILHLEVKVQCFLQIEAWGEAFVLLHKVSKGKVPVCSVPLREKYRVIKPNIILSARHFVKIVHNLDNNEHEDDDAMSLILGNTHQVKF